MDHKDVHAFKSVHKLSMQIRNKDLSPVELLESVITRIEERNKTINAFVHVDYDQARKHAKQAEKDIMNGNDLGTMHGIPTAIKDLFDFKPGWPSTFGGIRVLKDNIAQFRCTYAERMEQAGAIIVGKTNSPVMGFRGTCDNPLFGPTKNPFNHTKNSGGSSGGSAAAVADGLVPLAEGTDGGGSTRIPSAWCGLFGYQASYGRVPVVMRPNAFGGSNPFLYEGPITRNVEDAAIAMNVLTGYDNRDPLSMREKIDYKTAFERNLEGWKIGYSPNLDVFPIEEEVATVVQNAVKLFEDAGAHVEEITLGITRDQKELSDTWSRMIMDGSIGAFEGFKQQGLDILKDHRDDLPEEFIYWMEHVYEMKTFDKIKDQIIRTEIYDALEGAFQDYDLIITPTVATLPVDNIGNFGDTKGPTSINGIDVDPLIGWCLTYLTNFTGHPAASIPAGLSTNNLPVGMQIIGKRHHDLDVFTASKIFEQLKPWQHIYEICTNQ